jgi:hypothetical protein
MARKTKKKTRATTPADKSRALKRLTEPFSEWRFEAEAASNAVAWIVIMSLGGLALGAGVYANWIANAPIMYAPYILAGGVVLVAAYLMLGPNEGSALRVGELGVGVERDEKVDRTHWYDIESVSLHADTLSLATTGKTTISVSLKLHPAAARRIVAEALARFPKRVSLGDEEVAKIGQPKTGEGQKQDIDPPQVTGELCAASAKPLSIERDVRMCTRCGAMYHKSAVPARCVECSRKLSGEPAAG